MDHKMTDDQLDPILADFLDARRDEIIAAALTPSRAAQRVHRPVPASTSLALRPILVFTALLIVLLAMLLAAFAGARPFHEPEPLPRNGLLTFGLSDLPNRPYSTVHVVAADGTGDHAVGPGTGPIYSADGRYLVYWAGAWPGQVLTITSPDGTSPRAFPSIEADGAATLSPDGARVASLKTVGWHTLSGDDGSESRIGITELWVLPLDGSEGTLVADAAMAPDGFVSNPVWSPDGESIAYAVNVVTDDDAGGLFSYRSAIDIVRSDGSSVRRLTSRPGSDVVDLAWSPDGATLAYTAAPDGTFTTSSTSEVVWATYAEIPLNDVFAIAVDDGSEERDLSNDPAEEWRLGWSPDGSRISWVTGETGRLQVLRVDGARPIGEVIPGPLVDSYVWSPDATLIAFSSYEDPGTQGISSGQTVDASIETVPAADIQAAPEVILEVRHLVQGLSWQPLDPATPSSAAQASPVTASGPVDVVEGAG